MAEIDKLREKLAELTTIQNAIPAACGLAENCQPPISKPTEPPTTCQIIDQAIAHADKIIWQTDRDEPDLVDIEYKANLLKDLMEELRQANENCGNGETCWNGCMTNRYTSSSGLARELVERRIEGVKKEMQGNG